MKGSSWLGALLAPLAAPLVYAAALVVLFPDVTPKREREMGAVFVALLVFVPVSYTLSLVLGVPLIRVLRRLGRLSFWWVVLLAVPLGAMGFTVCLFALEFFGATIKWSGVLPLIGVGGVVGSSVAVVYSLLAGITSSARSDLHEPPSGTTRAPRR